MLSKTSEIQIDWNPQKVKVADLKEWKKNPRKITKEDFEALKESIQKRGYHGVLKVDVDMTIVSGHQGKRALKELGIDEVWVMVPERKLTDKEMDIIAVESNRHRGTFDFDMLANEFSIDDLKEAGFQDFELAFADENLEADKDSLEDTANSYLGGSIKQVVIFFDNEEYEEVLGKLDEWMKESGVKSHSDLFKTVVIPSYENNRDQKKS